MWWLERIPTLILGFEDQLFSFNALPRLGSLVYRLTSLIPAKLVKWGAYLRTKVNESSLA